MASDSYKLEIVSPEKTLFSGSVEYAVFPGEQGAFAVLKNHAPLISSLVEGTLKWVMEGNEETVHVKGGFVEVKNNVVIACVEAI